MCWDMVTAALAVLERAPRVGKRAAPTDSLTGPERLALMKLASAAHHATGLAWPSQASIAAYAGCTVPTIAAALAKLKARGHISRYDRQGLAPIYLVHPGGPDSYAPIRIKAARAHLGKVHRLPRHEVEMVLAWLADLGRLAGQSDSTALIHHTAGSLSASRPPPKPKGGVGGEVGGDETNPFLRPLDGKAEGYEGCEGNPVAPATATATPQSHEGHPPNPAAPPPLSALDEYSNQSPKGEFTKGERGGTVGRKCHPLPPVDSKAGALRDGAGGKPNAASGSKARAAKAEDWRTTARADTEELLQRIRAAGGREAERLEGMSKAEALAAAAEIKRTLGAFRAG